MQDTLTTYEAAMTDVKNRVNAARSSFQAGMQLLPRDRRDGMYAFYAFCRVVDDIADDSPTPEIAAQGLAEWRQKIQALFHGRACDSITIALLPAVRRYHLVEADFQAIIDGMEMDSIAIVAPDTQTLDLYCDRVASAVGRVSVRMFGDNSDNAQRLAYHLGRAFQLTNILRDLAEDAARGRLYLPSELLAKHGVQSRVPQDVLRDSALQNVCRDLAALAATHYKEADTCMLRSMALGHRAAMRPPQMMRAYYGAIFDRLRAADWKDPSTRISLSGIQKLGLALQTWASQLFISKAA